MSHVSSLKSRIDCYAKYNTHMGTTTTYDDQAGKSVYNPKKQYRKSLGGPCGGRYKSFEDLVKANKWNDNLGNVFYYVKNNKEIPFAGFPAENHKEYVICDTCYDIKKYGESQRLKKPDWWDKSKVSVTGGSWPCDNVRRRRRKIKTKK